MNKVYLLLGSNLGDSEQYIYESKKHIEDEIGKIIESSSLYKTAAWGKVNQPDFVNQVVVVTSSLNPHQVLEKALAIEAKLDRVRIEKWGTRTIDIDILFYEDQGVNDSNLTIPHPYLHQRKFTLIPLLEIAPQLRHPVLNKTIKQLYKELTDTLTVQQIVETT